jgi:hypothetical protein
MTDQVIQIISADDVKVLESLIIDNPELEQLETLLDQFNIFEALGAVWIELRHSDFLAFMLNPYQNHGLGDSFVKSFLQRALANAKNHSLPFRPIDLDIWDLDDLLVLREWQKIDITLFDERNQFIAIIENKIGSGEHSEQLFRYRQTVNHYYPGWRKLYLFLTPDGEEPSDLEYIPINYNMVVDLVEKFSDIRSSTIRSDVHTLLIHYCKMLRRYIVSESEIAELCRKIYRKHQRALDLIYEYRPDQQEGIRDILEAIISEIPEFEIDFSSKTYIRFLPKKWDVSKIKQGEGWTKSRRMLLFEFQNFPNMVRLHLTIGPGPVEIREKLYSMANQSSCFKAYRAFGAKWNTIFQRYFLSKKDYEEDNLDVLESILRKKWTQFLEQDFPAINDVVESQSWIWEE